MVTFFSLKHPVVGDDHLCGRGISLNGVPSLDYQFLKTHDEQLTYDTPLTSKNSDGFSL